MLRHLQKVREDVSLKEEPEILKKTGANSMTQSLQDALNLAKMFIISLMYPRECFLAASTSESGIEGAPATLLIR